MKHVQEILKIVLLGAFHFSGAYFFMAAFLPVLALQASIIMAMAALGGYLILVLTDNADKGFPIALLFLSPILYITAGIPWWIFRLGGWWPPRSE